MSAEPDAVPSTSDLPSGEPVPTLNAAEPLPIPQPPTPSSKPSSKLSALLKTAPSDIDAFLVHLHRCLQTPSGIDTVLLFVCYTSRLSASVLQALTGPAVRRSALQLIALADALPPSATLIFASTTKNRAFPFFSPSVALVLRLARRLKALSVLLSEIRTFMRLWGLLGMYLWGRGLVLQWRKSKQQQSQSNSSSSSSSSGEKSVSSSTTRETDKVETTIAWTQLAACVAFQSLENGAFLASKGILDWQPATLGKVSRWSSRFWGAFVGVELGRLLYEARKRGKRSARERIAAFDTIAEAEADQKAWSETWRKTFVRNLAWAPLTVHWSLERGYVSEMGIGALACVPGFIQMRDLWRRTAE